MKACLYSSLKFASINESQLVYVIPNCPTTVKSVAVFLHKWAKDEASDGSSSQ